MLQTTAVERSTLELLKSLQGEQECRDFCLVGGTALALYLGHRKSVDLDLFTQKPFDVEELEDFLVEKYGFCTTFKRGKTLKGDIQDVKIDCLYYPYDLLAPPLKEEGIRMLSIPDIIAMKLSAIADSGTRVKDFVDIACLSTAYSLEEMLVFYETKYTNTDRFRAMKGLVYFEDVNFSDQVMMLSGSLVWADVANRLEAMLQQPAQRFKSMPNGHRPDIITEAKAIIGEDWQAEPLKNKESKLGQYQGTRKLKL